MGSESEPQANDVGEKQKESREPTVWPDGLDKKTIIDSWDLGERASATIPIISLRTRVDTWVASELVLLCVLV